MVALGAACLVAALLACALRRAAPRSPARAAATAAGSTPRGARSTRSAALLPICGDRRSRPPSCAPTSRSRSSPTTPRRRRRPLQADRDVGEPGRARCCSGPGCSRSPPAAVLFLTRNRHREVVPWATAVLAGLAALLPRPDARSGAEPPFDRLDPAPVEGAGLNPLLRHPAMAIHPPMLYSGYVLFIDPVRVRDRRPDHPPPRRELDPHDPPLRAGRLALPRRRDRCSAPAGPTAELGWGGYWAWDPVENAALMPWLTGTAFLHSIMVQERRGMLQVWNVSLIVATFALSLLGTFLVRSGILQSIHAFGESKVGVPLLGLIAIVVARLDGPDRLAPRRPALRAADRLARSPASRSSWSTTCCSSASRR